MSQIHPTAVISEKASIADGVVIGPYAVIEGEVSIGKGTIVEHHASIGCKEGQVEVGENNRFLPSCVVGGTPQDLTYNNEKTKLIMGDNNTIREFVTINIGTKKEEGVTQIGSHNLLMAYCHIAHDCKLGDHNVIANSTHFGGHVNMGNRIVIGGGCLINQFSKLGDGAYVAGDSAVNKDVPPFTIVQGRYAVMRACNKVGLQRAGIEPNEIDNIYKAVRILIKGKQVVDESIKKIQDQCTPSKNISYLIDFIQSSERGLAF